jgi:hypothetical protein
MIVFPEQMAEIVSKRTIRVGVFDFRPAVRRGTLTCWLSTQRGGVAAAPALVREIRVDNHQFESPRFYIEDVQRVLPKDRALWLVVSYGPTVLATSRVRIP